VSGVKDSSGDPGRLLHVLEVFGGDVYTGSGVLLTMCGAVGGAGALVAVANSHPELAAAAFAGDGAAQLRLAAAERTAMAGFPAVIKRLVAERFGVSAACRVGG
jgi:4-hydroxy-tetrahydrodipicolinate synthase